MASKCMQQPTTHRMKVITRAGQQITDVTYVDANKLYDWAMSLSLPKSDFRWKKVMPSEEDILEKKKRDQRRDGYYRWTWSILKSCMKNTTAIHLRLRNRSLKRG